MHILQSLFLKQNNRIYSAAFFDKIEFGENHQLHGTRYTAPLSLFISVERILVFIAFIGMTFMNNILVCIVRKNKNAYTKKRDGGANEYPTNNSTKSIIKSWRV